MPAPIVVLTMLAVSERTPSAFTSAPSDVVCIPCLDDLSLRSSEHAPERRRKLAVISGAKARNVPHLYWPPHSLRNDACVRQVIRPFKGAFHGDHIAEGSLLRRTERSV